MLLSLWASFLPLVSADSALKWCGKVYEQGTPVVPPAGQFPLPAATSPQLALRCNPAQVPFLPDDDTSSSVILVDALVWSQAIAGAQPLNTLSQDSKLHVTVSLDGKTLTTGNVRLNGSAMLPFSLSHITPRMTPYTLACTAVPLSSPEQSFTSIPTNLTYLPLPPDDIGSVTKLDLKTGGLLAKRAHAQEPYQPIFPVGFFSNFDGYLEDNDTALELLKSQGINVVHPIPTFDNLTAFNHMVDKMEELGLWLMYEFPGARGTANLTSVTEYVMQLRNRTNLLLYYIADEPDGSEAPLSAPASSTAYINSLDPYRPSSLVLNCQDYFFSDYAAGTPILMPDPYPIGINATYSVVWNTTCTPDQGDCGCDNCAGDFEDIRDRIHDFATRLEVLGWERSKTIWITPQAFGGPGSRYWSRVPTGAEFLVQMIVAINAGARGSVAWNDPTSSDIKYNASALALALPVLTPFLLSSPLSQPPVHFTHFVTPRRLDFGVWASADGKTLVMGTNLNYFTENVALSEIFSAANHAVPAFGSPRVVLDGGGMITGSHIIFGSVQSGAWIFG